MMFQKNHATFFLLFIVVSIFTASCKLGDDQPSSLYGSGVYILNQGVFPNGSGDVSLYNRTIGGITNDLFSTQNNGAKLGNVVQSMINHYGTSYIVVNNADKIYLLDSKTFINKNVITEAKFPRYVVGFDTGKIYISQWGKSAGDSSVIAYKPSTLSVLSRINTGNGADKMLLNGSVLYVVNSGGLGKDSTVGVVSTSGDTLLYKIKVGLGPNSIVKDANGDLWVLSGGYYDAPGNGKLQRIRNAKVDLSFDVPKYADNLTSDANGNNLYYTSGNKVYYKDIVNFGSNPPTVFLTAPYFVSPNGLGIDPTTDYLYINDAKDYNSAGKTYIFNRTTKALVDSVKVGIIPGEFYFVK